MKNLNKEIPEDNNKNSTLEAAYQPLSFDAYNFFVKCAPYVEKILLNNINKYILQSQTTEGNSQPEATGLNKLDKEFIFPEGVLSYLFPTSHNDCTIIFNSNFLY